MSKPILLLATLALAALPLAGALPTPGAAVRVVDFAFEDGATGTPATVVVSGGKVTWTGVSGLHTVTAADGSFNSGDLGVGETFTITAAGPGVFPYSCLFHASMRGVLVVA